MGDALGAAVVGTVVLGESVEPEEVMATDGLIVWFVEVADGLIDRFAVVTEGLMDMLAVVAVAEGLLTGWW